MYIDPTPPQRTQAFYAARKKGLREVLADKLVVCEIYSSRRPLVCERNYMPSHPLKILNDDLHLYKPILELIKTYKGQKKIRQAIDNVDIVSTDILVRVIKNIASEEERLVLGYRILKHVFSPRSVHRPKFDDSIRHIHRYSKRIKLVSEPAYKLVRRWSSKTTVIVICNHPIEQSNYIDLLEVSNTQSPLLIHRDAPIRYYLPQKPYRTIGEFLYVM